MPAELHAHARAAAHPAAAPCPGCATGTLAERPDATVVRHHRTVAKAHALGTAPDALRRRLAVAAALPDILLPPLDPAPAVLDGRQVTCWPLGLPVDPQDPDAAPWEDAATLTARLHRTPPPPGLPAMRGPEKAALAVTRLTTEAPNHRAVPVLLRAWAALPPWARAEEPAPPELGAALCHGDLHLGQLVRHPAPDGPWRLIDVDDLGVGVPAWDLARPASWYACGLLPADAWQRFLRAYRTALGPALPAEGDPWAVLDVPARALTVQTASRFVAKAALAGRPLDEAEEALVDACDRMAAPPTGVP